MDAKVVGARLRKARELQGLSVADVTAGAGFSEERLEHVESGRNVTGDEVLILAAFYHHDFRDFIDAGRPSPFDQADILYRRHGEAFSNTDRRSIQEFLYLCEIEASLVAQLKIPTSSFHFHPRGRIFKRHGEEAAPALREFLGYGSREVRADVFSDFRSLGIRIFRRKLQASDISGLFIEHPLAGHCVLVNYDDDLYRQRFSVSHEVAHAIFDSADSAVVSYVPATARYDESDLKEIRANRFASCFLMPPDLLPKLNHWTADLATRWAQQFHVNPVALANALSAAGLVDNDDRKIIRMAKIAKAKKNDPEAPSSLNTKQLERRRALLEEGLSDYYVSMCFEAHYRGIISAGRLAEALLTDRAGLSEISVLYGRSINRDV